MQNLNASTGYASGNFSKKHHPILIKKTKGMLVRILMAVMLLLTACKDSNNSRASQEQATENALLFINAYVSNCNKKSQAIGMMDWVNSNKMVTEKYKVDVDKARNELCGDDPDCEIDYDLVFNAQDYPEKGFEAVSFDNSSNTVKVRGIDWPKFELVIKMVNQKNEWLVDSCGLLRLLLE